MFETLSKSYESLFLGIEKLKYQSCNRRHAVDCVHQVFQQCLETYVPNMIQ